VLLLQQQPASTGCCSGNNGHEEIVGHARGAAVDPRAHTLQTRLRLRPAPDLQP
jgi:hypothetical protein